MSLRVIGAGLGRTGTMSLKLALERLLRGNCYHMVEVFHRGDFAYWTNAARGGAADWPWFLTGYAATVDWPAVAFWEDLAAAFPDARVLLSTRRTAEEWWDSAHATIFAPDLVVGDALRTLNEAVHARHFTLDHHDRDAAIAAYDRHNAHVRAVTPPERLIEWQPGDGWGPLVTALGLPEPDLPFPHRNPRSDWARAAKR